MLRKTGWILSGVIISVLAMGSPVSAAFAESDLIQSPTGDVMRINQWEMGIHVRDDGPATAEFRMGMAPGWELGVDGIEDDGVGLNIRYQIVGESKSSPAIAVGISDIGRDDLSPYVALSQRFPQSFVRWHLGVGGGRYDGIFLGVSTRINTVQTGGNGNPISLMAEYVNNDLNLGVSFNFSQGWHLDIAGVDGDLLAGIRFKGTF